MIDYPRDRIVATDFRVAEWGGELAAQYRRVRPLVVLGTLAAWAGLCFELARPLGKSEGPSRSG